MTTLPKHPHPSDLELDDLPADMPTVPASVPQANRAETKGEHLRRRAHQGRLQGYAMAIIALIAVLVALAATNTGRVHVHWLIGSARVSLVWLVLAAAIIGWTLGVLASARFQWLTRARPHQVQSETSSSKRRRF